MTRTSVAIGLPGNIEFYDRGSYIEIVRKWFGWETLFLTAFAIFWDGFLVNWYHSIQIEAKLMEVLLFWDGFLLNWYRNIEIDTELTAMLFPVIHFAIGAGLSYYALASWFNKSHIFVNGNNIEIRHRPMPWFGRKEIAFSDIKQLYVKERTPRYRSGTGGTYEVQAIMQNGRTTKLVSGLETSEQAFYIEQQVQKYLNSSDTGA